MIEDAVSRSPRSSDTVIAVASSTDTSSLPASRLFSPRRIYRTARTTAITWRIGAGKNSLRSSRPATDSTSLSSYVRLSARPVCSGTRARFSAVNAKRASTRTTAARLPVYSITASHVRS